MARMGMVRPWLVLSVALPLGCDTPPDENLRLTAFVTVDARADSGTPGPEIDVLLTASVALVDEAGFPHGLPDDTGVIMGRVGEGVPLVAGSAADEVIFAGRQAGYGEEYQVLVDTGQVLVDTGETTWTRTFTVPTLHAVEFEAPVTVGQPATVTWSPSGDPSVRALGWLEFTESMAGTVALDAEADDGAATFTFDAGGMRRFGVMRVRDLEYGSAFLNVITSVDVEE